MKNMVILGGYSNKNIAWVDKISSLYKDKYNVNVIKYNHWHNGDFNLDDEVEKLSKLKDNYIVIAKSIGTYITLLGINKNYLNPKYVIFMGHPLLMYKEDSIDVKDDIKKLNENANLLIIQQENDKIGGYDEVKKELGNDILIKKIDGNDHAYDNYDEIKNIIDDFIN